MSGHSKWSKIKRKKGVNDAKRGNLFTKISKNITLSVKEGGGDPDMNFALRLAIDKAKAANMTTDKIKTAIDRGLGKTNEADIVRASYEAFGPEGVSIIIDCQTDNTNRTVSDVRKIVENHGGKLAEPGSVSWQFSEKGKVEILPKKKVESEKHGVDFKYLDVDIEDMQFEFMEIEGIEDITELEYEEENSSTAKYLQVITVKEKFTFVLGEIERENYVVENAELTKIANETLDFDQDQIDRISKLIEALDDHDDVSSVWGNF